jgi:hypothetical protein
MGPEGAARGWALAGREDELGLVERCRDLGDGAVVVTKPSGVGKSTAFDYLELQATFLCWGLRRSGKLGALLARARTWWDDPRWHRQLDTVGLLGPEVGAAPAAGLLEQHDTGPGARQWQ